jgi:hypothetical protein
MFQWLSGFFAGGVDPEPDLDHDLAALERELESAAPGARSRLLTRAAERCLKAGDRKAALYYYGRAIDACLDLDSYHAAEILCRRVLEVAPEAVRVRCTRAFLTLALALESPEPESVALHEVAERDIGDYTAAAARIGQQDLAVRRLRLMAKATGSAEVRRTIAAHLLRLGDAEGAESVRAAIEADRRTPAPAAVEQQRRWARALQMAVVDRDH